MKLKKYLFETAKYALRSYPVIRPYVKRIDRLYSMSQSEITEYNNRKFVDLVNLAYTKTTFYRKLYDEYGVDISTIKSTGDIGKLPIIDKKIVRENAGSIAIGNKHFLLKAATSGTTGEPLTIFQSYKSILTEQAYLYLYRKRCGFNYGEPLVSLRGHLDSKTFKMNTFIGNILYLSSYQLQKEKAIDYYNEISKFAPKAIEGYPSSIYNLCCLLKEAGLTLNIPLCFTSSETLYGFQRELFKKVLNCETFDWYGCTEHTIGLAEDKTHSGYFELPGYSYNEYFDNYTVTTSFINPRFPLIRYKVNDAITLKPDFVKHSAIDSNIKTIDGRTESTIITRSGALIGRLNFLFKNVNYIKLGQIVQHKQGEIEINIVPDGPFGDTEQSQIMKHVDERIGLHDIEATINIVTNDKIIYTKRNKFNQVVKL